MKSTRFIDQRQKEEFFSHSNLTYLVAFIAGFVLTGSFAFLDILLLTIAAFVATFIVAIALILNFKGYYGIASLVFIVAISLFAGMLSIFLGLETGFQYLFLSMSLLIVFSKWPNVLKIIAIVLEGLLFLFVAIHLFYMGPLHTIGTTYTLIFLIFNIVANILAVARIAYHYLKIARRAESTLKEFAETDFLTKLPNRAGFHSFVTKTKDYVEKGNIMPNLVILMIDLDNFKDVNDLYGHAIGDLVLIEIGRIFKKLLGENDFLSRYGGEEFVIVHFIDNQEEARIYAESVREEIESRKFRFADIDIKLTISIGGLFKPGACAQNCEDVLSEADKLLYKAKKAGRNCVIIKSLD